MLYNDQYFLLVFFFKVKGVIRVLKKHISSDPRGILKQEYELKVLSIDDSHLNV